MAAVRSRQLPDARPHRRNVLIGTLALGVFGALLIGQPAALAAPPAMTRAMTANRPLSTTAAGLPAGPTASLQPASSLQPAPSFRSASTPKATPAPAPAPGTVTRRIEREPTSSDLAQQQAQVAQLKVTEKRQAANVDDAQQAVRAAAELSGQALETYATAMRTLQSAQVTEQTTGAALEQAQQAVDTSRQALGQWARLAYQGGSVLAADPTLTMLFDARSIDDLSTDQDVLSRIGRARDRALTGVRVSLATANAASDRAADASTAAADAAVQATTDKEAADHAVNTQQQLLGVAQTALAQTHSAVNAASKQRAATALALARRAQAVDSKDNQVTGPVGSCTGGDDVGQYPNGQIPLAALCPLWAAPGQYLRADAAYAFDQLSHAYADQFGTPLCITDSYRTYAAQVNLYARKPNLAAIPGTSNHGWGTAVDLCGGIEQFGTVQHQWMLLNSTLYGWFHPAWAEPTGSRPEPWHWEFAG